MGGSQPFISDDSRFIDTVIVSTTVCRIFKKCARDTLRITPFLLSCEGKWGCGGLALKKERRKNTHTTSNPPLPAVNSQLPSWIPWRQPPPHPLPSQIPHSSTVNSNNNKNKTMMLECLVGLWQQGSLL